MKGLLFYDAHLIGQHRHCNICGRQITDLKAWIYRDDDIILFFCGDTARCRDEFLEMNSLQDVEDINVTNMPLIKNESPAYETSIVTCICPKCHEVVQLRVISK